jgi:glutamate-ammonia-ligase adenylyltransferase
VKKKFSFSNGFITRIIELTEGSIQSDQFEPLIKCLELEAGKFHFDNSSESNLLRIFNSLYDKKSFIQEITKYPHHPEILISIAANSNYLTDIVVRNPEYLYQLFDQEYLLKDFNNEDLIREVDNGVIRYNSFNAKLNYLKQIKKRFTLKIGIADILKLIDFTSTTRQLSILANVLTSRLFNICYEAIEAKYSISLEKNKFCLCSLGKLGGNELNYSSDIDLLLFYDENELYDTINKEYHELLSETSLLFIKSASDITDKGYLYRVDFRLRPDGKYSPLCKSLNDYTKYYETRGEDWERQMLIKLSFITGSRTLFNNFRDFLKPYIFPNSYSQPLKEQIHKIKKKIELSNSDRENVKLFKGGIRDIEFSVQALQLINGGKIPELKTGNTIEAVNSLHLNKLLSNKEKNIFLDAYYFYRKIEHFLQLMNDTQTHLIPESGDMQKKLSMFLGFSYVSEFKVKLNQHRKDVRKIYESILSTGDSAKAPEVEEVEFKDKSRAIKSWNYLSNGIGIYGQKEFDQRTVSLFEEINPDLIEYLKKSSAPDRVLDNFVKIIRSVTPASIWYAELCDKLFLKNILLLCEFSDKAINLLVIDKSCSEQLLTRRIFLDISLEELSQWTYNQLQFYLSVRFALGLLKQENLSETIAGYLINRIKNLLAQTDTNPNFFIAGLGSISTSTLSFASDIDLVLVAESEIEAVEKEKSYLTLIGLLQEKLKPLAVDFRLRPEGKRSQLIWSINKFNEYIRTRAKVWELEAFSKLSFIYGNKFLFDSLTETVIKTAGNLPAEMIKNEIKIMDKKIKTELLGYTDYLFNIKKQSGGLATIDFIIDSVILSNKDILQRAIGAKRYKFFGLLAKGAQNDDVKILNKNFRTLKLIELAVQNIFDVSNSIIPKSDEKKSVLSRWLKLFHGILIDVELKNIVKTNNELFKKYLG